MLKPLLGQPLALTSVGLASAAVLLLTGGLVYFLSDAAAEIPLFYRLLVGLLAWIWLSIPYWVNIGMASYLAPWRPPSAVLLVGTIGVTAFGAWKVLSILLRPSSTAGVALMVLPLFQLLFLLIVTLVALRFNDTAATVPLK
jgi:hypothetical protein